VQNTVLTAVDHLNNIIPKATTPTSPLSSAKWQPDDLTIGQFKRQAAIINEPARVVQSLASNTLTGSEMNTMQTVYPALLDLMRAKVMEALAHTPNATLPASKRGKLELFMGNASSNPTQLAMLQNNFNVVPNNNSDNTSKPVPPQMIQNYATSMQKLQEKTNG